MNGLPPASHSQPAHKMYTAGSLELHRGVEIQLCNTHKHRNIYQLCAEYFLDITHNGLGTFIAYLPTTRSYNATFTLSSGTLGRFSHGLRLTRKVLYCTLTSRPNKKGCGRAAVSPRSLLPYPCSLSGLWLPLILKRYYLKI